MLAKSAEKLTLSLALIKLFMVALGICYPSIFSLKDFFHFYYKFDSFYRGVNSHWILDLSKKIDNDARNEEGKIVKIIKRWELRN